MKLFRDIGAVPPELCGAVIALGNFDGIHLAHQAIVGRCRELAAAGKKPAMVMSFEPHPREFFARAQKKEGTALRLYPLRYKLALLRGAGLDAVFLARFNSAFAALSAESFIRRYLQEGLSASHIVTGYNFAFGKGREGDTDFLGSLAGKLGIGFTAVDAIADAEGAPVSSSAIRRFLSEGNIGAASAMLGRPYRIVGHVRRGEARGRLLGFPTANLDITHLHPPRFGVYAARARFGQRGGWIPAVANIGVKPTFGAARPLAEVHCFDFAKSVYGELAELEPIRFIRAEQRFASADELKAQIASDCAAAREVLSCAI